MQVLPKKLIKRFWVDTCFQFRSMSRVRREWCNKSAAGSWKKFQAHYTNKEVEVFDAMIEKRSKTVSSKSTKMKAHRMCRKLNLDCGVIVECPLCNQSANKLSADVAIPRKLCDILKQVNPTDVSPTDAQIEKEMINMVIEDIVQTIWKQKASRILDYHKIDFMSGAKTSIEYSELKNYTCDEVQQIINKVFTFEYDQVYKILKNNTIKLSSYQCNMLRAVQKLSPSPSQWKDVRLIFKHYVDGKVKDEYHSQLKACDLDAIECRSFSFGRVSPSIKSSVIVISEEVRAYMDISKMEMYEKIRQMYQDIRQIAKNAVSESILESKKRGKELAKGNDTKRNKYDVE